MSERATLEPGWYWVRMWRNSDWRPLLWVYGGWRENIIGRAYVGEGMHEIGPRILPPDAHDGGEATRALAKEDGDG